MEVEAQNDSKVSCQDVKLSAFDLWPYGKKWYITAWMGAGRVFQLENVAFRAPDHH